MMLVTSTRPVIRQTTTVSQKVPVLDTRAWRTGFLVCAAAAAIGAEPMPDSLENKPSGDTVLHGDHDPSSHQTAGSGSRRERPDGRSSGSPE